MEGGRGLDPGACGRGTVCWPATCLGQLQGQEISLFLGRATMPPEGRPVARDLLTKAGFVLPRQGPVLAGEVPGAGRALWTEG
jgi:hypothetical protein